MDIRIIAFGMIAVLALLFIGAKFYIPQERTKTKWEAQYAVAAQNFFKEASQENYVRCREILSQVFHDPEKVEAKLKKDKITLPS